MAAERAWKSDPIPLFQFFTPEGRFNDRQQAQAVVAGALRHLSGPARARPGGCCSAARASRSWNECMCFGQPGSDPDVLSALLDLEGLQCQAWRLSKSTPGSAATPGLALARTVQLAKAEPHWQELVAGS